MSTNTTIIPDDQTFGSSNDTFSIEDIAKQNSSLDFALFSIKLNYQKYKMLKI